MQEAFRKISRVGNLSGGMRWYLSEDCLLAAKRVLYTVEYRRFYLRDLEYVVVWPNPLWIWRLIIPAVFLAGLGASLWEWVNATAGAIFVSLALAWALLELALGPTAKSQIRTTGATVELALIKRTRRARKVLAKIDAAVRTSRGVTGQEAAPVLVAPAEASVQLGPETSASTRIATATQTNAS